MLESLVDVQPSRCLISPASLTVGPAPLIGQWVVTSSPSKRLKATVIVKL